LVYDTMYQLQLDGSFKLSLAESVTVSDDSLTYTYKIRDDMLFSVWYMTPCINYSLTVHSS
jgi:ABC-type transport system substrate-binding protein